MLDRVSSPQDLKSLHVSELRALARDIRGFLIRSLSDTGGHLASNLGVVELTLALHFVFNTPVDKIVWDVGHQSYVHKILTGRREDFCALRKLDGLSGFPKPTESDHDSFATGHSSTSISAALGLAIARDLQELATRKAKSKVVAVIGDGSMTGGLAFEGLNNAGRANTDLLVILNDNQMSIGRNVGALSKHLNTLRTGTSYLGAKEDVHQILDKMPVFGTSIGKGIESFKSVVKRVVLPGVLFEEMGFRYFGPVNGHDIPSLLNVLQNVKNIKGPVLLHVLTKKGKGYSLAERSPTNYHGVGTFSIATGRPVISPNKESYTDVFSKHLVKCAAKNKKIVAITAAMHDGTGLSDFKAKYPKRFFDVGIAEAHAVTFAAGLAKSGLHPVVAIYSSFLQRAYDQIIHDVAVQNLPVIFAIDRAGIVGEDGETHQGLYDIAFLSHIPNMTVLAPSSGEELAAMLDYALTLDGPVAIRYPKAEAASLACEAPLENGHAVTVVHGSGVAIVAVGSMMDTARQVVEILQAEGLTPSLYNARFIKPIESKLPEHLTKYASVFTIEDATLIGGFGMALQAKMAELPRKPRQKRTKCVNFAFPDSFIEAGTRPQLMERYGLDAGSISNKILKEHQNGNTTSKS